MLIQNDLENKPLYYFILYYADLPMTLNEIEFKFEF